MADIYNQVLLHWIDENGKPAVSFAPTQNQDAGAAADYSGLASALQNCCDAAIVAIQFQQTLVIGATPTSGAYKTVWDRGVLLGRNAVTNAPQRTVLVGPKESVFLSDHVTIDLTNTNIIAVQTEVEALIGDSLGHPAGPFRRGVRQKASGG